VPVKGKSVLVTGRVGLYGCVMSRSSHFLENRLTDGGEVVSLTHRPPALYSQEDSRYSILLEAESTIRVIVRLERLGQMKNPMTLLENEPNDLLVLGYRSA
jgi:hypothetical protein